MSKPEKTPDEMREALDLARKVEAKAQSVLDPLIHEMLIMKWPQEYRSILWNVVAHKAMRLAGEEPR